jgi:hypothetical protein
LISPHPCFSFKLHCGTHMLTQDFTVVAGPPFNEQPLSI